MQVFTHFTANDVQLEPFPFKRELSMQAYLIENEGVLALDKDTFSNVEIIETELTVKESRKNKEGDGRIDILATYSAEYIAVAELKLGKLEEKHLKQLKDYLNSKEKNHEKYKKILSKEIIETPKWIGVLVGNAIDDDLAKKINSHINNKNENYLLAALIIQRFRGANGSVYVTTDTYFNQVQAANDTTKYTFNGMVYGKGRLVLAAIKYYVALHPDDSYAVLERQFPAELQGSFGVFSTLEAANIEKTNKGRKRHFIKPDEVIKLTDSTIAVCDQWGIGNIDKFIKNWNECIADDQTKIT